MSTLKMPVSRSSNGGSGKDPQKRRGKFVYTLFWSFLVVGTIPLVLSAWMFVGSSREWLGRNQRIMQLESGKHINTEIDTYLESCSKDIYSLAELLSGSKNEGEFRQQISSPGFDAFLKRLISRSRFSQIHVLGPQGTGVRASVGANLSQDDSMLSEALKTSLERPELIVSPPLERGGERSLIFSKNIQSGSATLGAVLGIASLEPLAEKISGLGVDHEVFVADRQGEVILSNRRVSSLERELESEIRNLEGQVVKNIVYASEQKKATKVATLIPNQNLGWFIVVQADEYVTYYPVRQVILSTSLWLVVALVLAGVSGLIVSRRISQPVRQLVAGSESLASGKFEERVQIQSQNEIGELAEHFNTMAARIQGYVEDLKAAVESNRQLFLEAVQTVAAAIDEKDPYTKGHSERVTHYAVQVAEEMGLAGEELDNIRVSALLHDVGKIGIPDEILQKPISLDSREFEIMKQHPVKGARIIGQISQLQDVIAGILYHHEKVDGTGYPEGLNGAQIPMQAKIISVADTFDALTTQRPYQSAMTLEAAVARIESFIGTRYDAAVVEALKTAIAKKRIKLRRMQPRAVTFRDGRLAG